MTFDWERAIAKNRDDLIEIVTRLFVMAGIRSFRSVAFLPRGLRLRIIALLRPAEFAARRLIAMAACQLEFKLRPAKARGSTPSNAVILGLDPRTHSVKPEASVSRPAATPAFALFDPFKPFHPWLEEGDADAGAHLWPAQDFASDELVQARAVCRRIVALEAALQDLEGQARRLARWRARRHLETARPRRWSPMRPGRPPGWRRRPKTAIEEVLKECHGLALSAWSAPDTS